MAGAKCHFGNTACKCGMKILITARAISSTNSRDTVHQELSQLRIGRAEIIGKVLNQRSRGFSSDTRYLLSAMLFQNCLL